MSISIIIPAYKARNFLAGALDSVVAQTFQDWEILVIDDQSPEPVDDIIEDFTQRSGHDIRLIRHEKNQGLGGARNTGIREATAEWVAFLDHDDLWAPGHLQALLDACEAISADLAFCTVKQFNEDPADNMSTWGPDPDDVGENMPIALFEKSFITPSATLVRRHLLLESGGFDTDPRVHMCEDLDLWLRLLMHGARFAYVETPGCYYRKHDEAATARAGYMAFQSAWVRQQHFHSVPGHWFQKRSIVAYHWWQAWLAFLRKGETRWDILARAIWQSLPVPHQLARGIIRTIRQSKKST